MVIQQVFSAAPSAQLGAVDLSLPLAAGKSLSVKGYAQGWASYQSPSANEILKDINTNLRILGFASVRADGVINNASAAAVKLLASIASVPGIAGLQLASGGTAGYAGTILRHLTDAQSLARGGVEGRYYIRALAQNETVRRFVQNVNAGGSPSAPSAPPVVQSPSNPSVPVTIPTPSSPTYTPDAYASPGPSSGTPRWAWGVAGGILLIGLGTATYFAWR